MELRRRIIEASKLEMTVRQMSRRNDTKHKDLRRSLDNFAARKALARDQAEHQTHPAASASSSGTTSAAASASAFQNNRNTMMVSQSQPALPRVASGGIIRRRGLPCTQRSIFIFSTICFFLMNTCMIFMLIAHSLNMYILIFFFKNNIDF